MTYSSIFLKLSLDKYEIDIKICIKTETGIFEFIKYNRSFSNFKAKSILFSKNIIHYGECTILANKALEKSRQKICIFLSNDFLIKLTTHYIILFSIKVGMTASLILIFYKIAIQNLWVTEPL